VTPIVSPAGLYVFMEPTSPKGRDLRERRRYAIHNGVSDSSGTGGEFYLSGEGVRIDDASIRAEVALPRRTIPQSTMCSSNSS